jgi:hypothetical protein
MAELLPDLRTLKGKYGRYRFLIDVKIAREGGRTVLRFSNAIANYGKGPLEVTGDLDDEREAAGVRKVRAYQAILQTDGSRKRRRAGDFIYDAHPDHDHWHYGGFSAYRLKRGNNVVIESRKQAFCLVDIAHTRPALPRSPAQRWYAPGGCEALRMGISVGWADVYERELHGQFVDLTDVESGTYWLESETNPDGALRERRAGNNRARVRIRINKENRTVRVL